VVFDPDETWKVSRFELASKSRNTPYDGRQVRGKVRHTIFNGRAVVIDSEATGPTRSKD
jgi:dihydroorotase